jgi:hypothetical protein
LLPPPTASQSSSKATLGPGEFVSLTTQAGNKGELLPIVIINVRKAIDRKQFVGKKLKAALLGPSGWGLQFLDDKSFVVGPDQAVVQFAAHTSDKESELGRQLAQEVAQPMIQGGYRLTPQMKKALANEPGGVGPLSLFFPLVNVTSATFAYDFGKIGDIKLRFTTSSGKQANLAAQSAKTLLAATEVYCDESIAELEKSVADAADDKARGEIRDSIIITRGFRDMAKMARVDQRQAEVSVAMQIDIPVRQAVVLLEGLMTTGFMRVDQRPMLGKTPTRAVVY